MVGSMLIELLYLCSLQARNSLEILLQPRALDKLCFKMAEKNIFTITHKRRREICALKCFVGQVNVGRYFPVNILHGLDMSWTWADLCLPHSCLSWLGRGLASQDLSQVQPKHLGLPMPTSLLGCAQLGMPKQLIGLATAETCPST